MPASPIVVSPSHAIVLDGGMLYHGANREPPPIPWQSVGKQ